MMYVRGMDVDDGWAAAGATGWDAATMNDLSHHLEDDQRGLAPHRGIGGPLRVEHQRDPSPLSQAFLDACDELGMPRVEDYHADTDGCGLTMVTQRNGRRWSAADAFLRPAMAAADARLTVRTGVDVHRVIVEGGRAVGVDVLVGGIPRFARASQEVIVSAGTVGTPHLLLRSGIGAAEHLASVGVPVVADLAGVGENLQDHVLTRGRGRDRRRRQPVRRGHRPVALLRYVTKKRGPLTSNLGEAIALVRTRHDDAPDGELVCLPVGLQDHGRGRYPEHGISIAVILLRPVSRGSIRLASGDPAVPPILDPGTFTDGDGDDLRRLSDGLRWCQRLVTDSATLGARITHLIDPAVPLTTEQDITNHVRSTAKTLSHRVGTCRMGSDADAVVDPDLRVTGIDGRRVADASVMPTLIRGHTNAPAIAIGERASRLIANPARM